MPQPLGLLLTQLDVPDEMEEEYNAWYETEHMPERLRVPGFLSGRRGRRNEALRYIALYDLAALNVLESAPYLAVSGDNKSPWTRRVLARAKSGGRRLYMQVGAELARADHPYTVLVFLPAGTDEATVAAGLSRLSSLPEAAARRFVGEERVAGQILVVATAATEAAATAASEIFAGATVERYGPTAASTTK